MVAWAAGLHAGQLHVVAQPRARGHRPVPAGAVDAVVEGHHRVVGEHGQADQRREVGTQGKQLQRRNGPALERMRPRPQVCEANGRPAGPEASGRAVVASQQRERVRLPITDAGPRRRAEPLADPLGQPGVVGVVVARRRRQRAAVRELCDRYGAVPGFACGG